MGKNLIYILLNDEDPENASLIIRELPNFEIRLLPQIKGINEKGVLNFYENRKVPRETYKYFSGVYEGKARINNPSASLFCSQSGGIEVKVVFLEDWKLQLCVKSMFFNLFSESNEPMCNIVDYHVEGEKIILDNSKNGIKEFEIEEGGRTLLLINENFTVKLRK